MSTPVKEETPRDVAQRIVRELRDGPNGVVFHTTRAYESNPNVARSLVNSIEAALRNEREARDERAVRLIDEHRAMDVCNDNCWTTIKAAIRGGTE